MKTQVHWARHPRRTTPSLLKGGKWTGVFQARLGPSLEVPGNLWDIYVIVLVVSFLIQMSACYHRIGMSTRAPPASWRASSASASAPPRRRRPVVWDPPGRLAEVTPLCVCASTATQGSAEKGSDARCVLGEVVSTNPPGYSCSSAGGGCPRGTTPLPCDLLTTQRNRGWSLLSPTPRCTPTTLSFGPSPTSLWLPSVHSIAFQRVGNWDWSHRKRWTKYKFIQRTLVVLYTSKKRRSQVRLSEKIDFFTCIRKNGRIKYDKLGIKI